MTINLKNFLNPKMKISKIRDFQELKEIKGLSLSSISADYMEMAEMILHYFILKRGQNLQRYIQNQRLPLRQLTGI